MALWHQTLRAVTDMEARHREIVAAVRLRMPDSATTYRQAWNVQARGWASWNDVRLVPRHREQFR